MEKYSLMTFGLLCPHHPHILFSLLGRGTADTAPGGTSIVTLIVSSMAVGKINSGSPPWAVSADASQICVGMRDQPGKSCLLGNDLP